MKYTKELHYLFETRIMNGSDFTDFEVDCLLTEIERLQSLTQWVRCELYEPEEYGDVLEFIDKAGTIYKGYWNCGYISCDETGHDGTQIIDVVGWRIFKSPEGVK